jgi:DNA polymerase III epsilon subunit-like protein
LSTGAREIRGLPRRWIRRAVSTTMDDMDRPLVAIDVETATARGAPHLLEIGAARVVNGEIVDTFDELVRPEVPIDPDASAIHGICDEDVREAADARDVLSRFTRWIGGDWMAAHGARSDAWVIAFECTRHALEMPPGLLFDSLKLARKRIDEVPDHKLETLCQFLDVEGDVRHRALADAVSCWKVIEACIERFDAPAPSTWSDVFARCAPITFATSAPKKPRVPQRLRALEQACRERDRVTLVYGETQELSHLCVTPRLLFEQGERAYLEAECARSGLIKTYRLDRVQRVLATS